MSNQLPTSRQTKGNDVQRAIRAFRRGDPILVHDAEDREGETDLMYPASGVTPRDVGTLRNQAGGLICVAISNDVAEEFDLPYLQDALDHPATTYDTLSYGDRSSFSLPVNHVDTYTGITDEDRALTIRELASAVEYPDQVDFATEFHVPGHVHILKAASGLFKQRRGHTELGVALAKAAGQIPAVVVCEMLDDRTSKACAPERARAFGTAEGVPFVEGKAVVETLG